MVIKFYDLYGNLNAIFEPEEREYEHVVETFYFGRDNYKSINRGIYMLIIEVDGQVVDHKKVCRYYNYYSS